MAWTVKQLINHLQRPDIDEDAEVVIAVDNRHGGIDVFLDLDDSFAMCDYPKDRALNLLATPETGATIEVSWSAPNLGEWVSDN